MIVITGPMNFDTAYLWAMSNDRLTQFGKGSKWGLYTETEISAYRMAFALGTNAEPVFDSAKPGSGIYNHFHVNGRNFKNHFKHFHVWYGSLA